MKGFRLASVSKTYKDHKVLSDISLTLSAEMNTALLGSSGCGKSTLLRVLAGLESPSAGQVLLDEKVISDSGRMLVPAHARGVSMVFQDLGLWPNLNVVDNVLLGLSGSKLRSQEARSRAEEALSGCGIRELANRRPGTLSGGQQQRAALARALAVRPRFLFLDEPFAGLDLVTKTQLLSEISALSSRHGFSVLLVCHDPLEAATLCRSAIVLEQGSVKDAGLLDDLLCSPRSELLRVFREHLPAKAKAARKNDS